MKCVKVDLPKEHDEIKVEIFSDLHIGSKKCDYNSIRERIERVKNENNRYCVIAGDVINNSTKTSVGDVYEEELTPMQQVKQAIMLFEPIKDKIIGICAGNHERRSYKTDGVDLLYFLASELRLTDRYDYASCLVFVRLGHKNRSAKEGANSRKVCYSIYMTHGDGQGGRTIGGKANGLQRRGQVVNADIVITGHTHAPLSFRDCCYEVDYQNNSIYKKEQLFVNASATLNYEEYAELYGMRPSSVVSPVILLDGHKKFAKVIM